MIHLKPRLEMTANMIRAGSAAADIGTDHAFLPVYLIQSGRSPRVIASDLRQGPLDNARETVRKFSLEESISLRLSDGLDSFLPGEFGDAVLAGMGGLLISEILGRCEWIFSPQYSIAAQPMTHSENLRRFFFENGFVIKEENACFEDGKSYIAMRAEYSGKKTDAGEDVCRFGIHPIPGNAASFDYFNRQLKRAETRLNAIENICGCEEEADMLRMVCEKARERSDGIGK